MSNLFNIGVSARFQEDLYKTEIFFLKYLSDEEDYYLRIGLKN